MARQMPHLAIVHFVASAGCIDKALPVVKQKD
jgi:hypothetical protein